MSEDEHSMDLSEADILILIITRFQIIGEMREKGDAETVLLKLKELSTDLEEIVENKGHKLRSRPFTNRMVEERDFAYRQIKDLEASIAKEKEDGHSEG